MFARPKIQRPACTAVLVAYGLLATGVLHGWHDLCIADCHDAAHAGDVLENVHHEETHGTHHSADCPICHQLNVASSATPQIASLILCQADDQFLGHRADRSLLSAQMVNLAAAPRAPPHLS